MSRTDAHTPYTLVYTPDDIWWGPRQNVGWPRQSRMGETDTTPWHEANKHFGRRRAVRAEARRLNRVDRHTARAMLRAGRWDLPTTYCPRHAAVWNVS